MSRRSLAEHTEAVVARGERMGAIAVLTPDAAGAMLAEDLRAEGPLPPVATATCDGYAVVADEVGDASEASPVTLQVSHDVSWKSRSPGRHIAGTAARIASGAPLPRGADAVVPAEATDGGIAKVAIQAASHAGANVLSEGAEAAAGQVLVSAGTRLGAQQLALAAMLGRRRVSVYPTPRVVIVAAGAELTEPGSRSRGGVPESTTHALAIMAQEAGAQAYRVGVLPHDRIGMRTAIEDQLVRADVVVTTGGLSGQEDPLRAVLEELGSCDVAQVALMPGRWHGVGAISLGEADQGTPVVALPGDPAAAIIAFEMYVRPLLRMMSGHAETARRSLDVPIDRDIESSEGVVHCVPVAISGPRDQVSATVVGDPWHPSLVALAQADALAVVPDHVTHVGAGQTVPCLMWNS